MESPIDYNYRQLLINRLDGYEESVNKRYKARFFCPFCQYDRDKKKYAQKKGAIFWHQQSNSWRINCIKCHRQGISMFKYLGLLDSSLARQYQHDRWCSGTTGWGHDCPTPDHMKRRSI